MWFSFFTTWEQRKLGDIFERIVRKNVNNESSLPLTISAQDGLVDQITYFNNRVASRDVSNYYLVLNGEFAYNKSTSDGYPYGAVKRLDLYEKGVLSTLYIVFALNDDAETDSDYMAVFFDTDRWHRGVAERAAEGARNHGLLNISAEDFFDIGISLPGSIDEQRKIGRILKRIDNLITLHQRKQKDLFFLILSKNLSLILANDWEQRKVGELLEERDVKAPKSLEYPLMAFIANEGVAPKGDRYDRSALVNDTENKPYKQTELGDFIYSSNNLETGSIGLNKYGKASISPVYSIFYSTGLADSDFLGRRFVRKDFINEMVKWRQGVIYGQWRIHESDFVKIEVAVPCVEEQRKIGRLLDNIDNLITLHQCKRAAFFDWQRWLYSKFEESKITLAWEQRKLGEFGNFTSNGVDKLSKPNEIPVSLLNYMDVYNRRHITAKTCMDLMQVTARPVQIRNNDVRAGDVYFTPTSETAEDIGHSLVIEENLPNTVYSYHLMRYRPRSGVFFKTYPNFGFDTKYLHDQMAVKAKGVQRFVISKPDFEDLQIICPSYYEQESIARFLTLLDNLITLHQRGEKINNRRQT